MTPDKRLAERRRFARLLGTVDDAVGLPVGSSDDGDGSRRERRR
ncbi:hypothetical protein [Natrialbaceae archaeon AArc-T1-2]|nr:hypothetical protein [Natrialbaceae archaeon AArc-T1-2]WIV68147.1 hypothetical protein QQ977_05305 [Natrialbaceae archaeon AArc-T1-2]